MLPQRFFDMARATVFPIDRVDSTRRFLFVYLLRLFFLVGQRLWRDHCPRQAAALSFQTILSLVPLIAVIFSVAATFSLNAYQERLLQFIESKLLPEAASAAGSHIVAIASGIHLKSLGLVGGATLLILSLTLLFNIEHVMNEIYRSASSRRFGLRVLAALLLLIGAPLALGLSLYFTRNLIIIPGFANAVLPLFFTFVSLFLSYWLLPHARVQVRFSLLSAAVAGVLFELLKIGFALYANYLGATLSYVYGAFAMLPLFMVWLYFAWLVFLFGAELSAALHEVYRHDRLKNSPV